MGMKKIVMVVHRYGEGFSGGAEFECRALAERLVENYSVKVLTSCSMTINPWENVLTPGKEILNGVEVFRFSIEEVGEEKLEKEEDYARNIGPFCPKLIEYLKAIQNELSVIFFYTYIYYPTIEGMLQKFPNAVLIPTAHDEPAIYKAIYKDVFLAAKAFIYNSIEEKEFVESRFSVSEIDSVVTCVGIEIPDISKKKKTGLGEKVPYIVYFGRLTEAKGVYELLAFFREYKRRNCSDLQLIIAGGTDVGINLKKYDNVKWYGYVSEEEKILLMANAKALIMPSFYESLSIVILESMAVKTPILVNGRCPVLRGQCFRSNAGLWYNNYFEFEAALDYLLMNPDVCKEMGENGFRYVRDNYDWGNVIENVEKLIERVAERSEFA